MSVQQGHLDTPWIPFTAYRLYFLMLAVFVPGPYWVNALLMAGFVVEGGLIWTIFRLADLPTAIVPYEPVTTATYALVGVFLLAFRISHDRLARELERTRTRAETMEQVARLLLTLRDRANSPLLDSEDRVGAPPDQASRGAGAQRCHLTIDRPSVRDERLALTFRIRSSRAARAAHDR